ncbi:MAG: DUF1080 domain-containing protein [Puniceicoccales bacterium]|jgi:hypothetical protein|nr:DUF1080 domain-containing protein [Puniceicoccales bacterium]
MRSLRVFLAGFLFLAATVISGGAAEDVGEAWLPLLDAKLSQWEPFLGVPGKGIEVPGHTPAKGKPIGLRDPTGVFTVKSVDGEPVLHVSGEILGGLTTLKSFENYHLRLQFRWGEKRWPPRARVPRDSGILYHCVGEHGAFGNAWMRSVEYQIQENDVGDFFPLCGSRADFPVKQVGSAWRYEPGAPLKRCIGRVMRGEAYHESPFGEWNTVELVVIGADSIHVLNRHVVNELRNIRYLENGRETPLKAGKLQLQSEYAEIEYRRVEIRPVKTFPKEFSPAKQP